MDLGKGGRGAGVLATAAIVVSFVLSACALVGWLAQHPLGEASHHAAQTHSAPGESPGAKYCGQWYTLAEFDALRVSIDYYIDGLTIAMFCMVTLVAACIHVYSFGYMHEELGEVIDPLVTLADGQPLRRPGRFPRFFQYLSLFCFSMLGLVVAGNVVMVFVFWELVGICSYLLIGFYRERRSASNAANKAFIVNRIGDFGMIVGVMAVWTGFGTFSFGDANDAFDRPQPGIFSQVRPAANNYALTVPDGMVKMAARDKVAKVAKVAREVDELNRAMAAFKETFALQRDSAAFESNPERIAPSPADVRAEADQAIAAAVPLWRSEGYGYWLLVIAGLGIFCGCVGKSAQFPLFVWLPDAMEGPTPVSALIHAATMVAAGVYLVGRFYPVFTPEVLLVIAYVGCITLFIAATIAIVATDIKRVLAYSTVSQLGYMMLALGIGGWLAGMLHLFTHAFFKSLLFLCSGSVIHACGTNEMPQMGGLRKKMPWTAYTMLIGCLAISGAGVPTLIGLSGYYSKDYILAQALSFHRANGMHPWLFYLAVAGAAVTAFYMFRLWYLTFAGEPRDAHVGQHAHESPPSMVVPLVILAAFSIAVAWNIPFTNLGLEPLLDQARPAGISAGTTGGLLLPHVVQPPEYLIQVHTAEIPVKATLIAFVMALLGFLLATFFYGLRKLDPADARRQFASVHGFLLHKWWLDELYDWLFVRPLLRVCRWVADFDKRVIDWLADNSARAVAAVSRLDDWIDRTFIDTAVNLLARWTHALGLRLRAVQTGSLHQYVVFIAVGTVTLFVLMSLYWKYAIAGM